MKKINLGIIIFFICIRIAYARFGADISLRQDSLDPYKFTATIRVLNYPVFDFEKDSIIVIWDNVQKKIPLFDTVIAPFNRSICIYKDTYTFAQTDSGVKIIGAYPSQQRPDGIYNIDDGHVENLSLYIEAGLNLNILKSTQGEKSLIFESSLFIYDTVGKSISHPSEIIRYNSDSFRIELVKPYQSPNNFVPVYQFPHEYSFLQNDTSYVDSQGNFYWDTTYSQGLYCIAFKVTEYLSGELLYFTMRDMLLTIIHQPTSITDEKLDANNILIYPNPTNQTHHLTFVADKQQRIKITLFNAIGMKVSDVFSGISTEGNNRIPNDVSMLASGFYIYSVEFDDRVENVSFVKF